MSGWEGGGGGTILPNQIARGLAKRGNQVTVIYSDLRKLPGRPMYSVEVVWKEGVRLFGIHNLLDFSTRVQHPEYDMDNARMRHLLSQLLSSIQPDIVHYHSLSDFSMSIIEEFKHAGIPGIYTSHNYWPLCPRMYLFKKDLTPCSGPSKDGSRCAECIGRLDKTISYARRTDKARQLLSETVDLHLTVSERVRRIFIQNDHDGSRIDVLHPQPETADSIWRQAGLCRPPGVPAFRPLRIGFLGNLYAWKGVHILIEALQMFDQGVLEAHIFGDGPNSYLELLRQKDRKHFARFHGRYGPHDLYRLLGEVDVVVVPSICEETGGLVVLEALSARVPVVGSRIGGIPEFIQDGVNGFLCDPGNPVDLAAILQKFTSDRNLLPAMQKNIVRPEGFGAYLDKLSFHYKEVIAVHRRPPEGSLLPTQVE